MPRHRCLSPWASASLAVAGLCRSLAGPVVPSPRRSPAGDRTGCMRGPGCCSVLHGGGGLTADQAHRPRRGPSLVADAHHVVAQQGLFVIAGGQLRAQAVTGIHHAQQLPARAEQQPMDVSALVHVRQHL